MDQNSNAPAAATDEAPITAVKTVSAAVGMVGLAWATFTPILAMYAVGYKGGNFLFSILALVLTVGAIFVFLHPKGPLFIANKAAALAARVALGVGLTVFLAARGLTVWAVIYGLITVAVVWAVRSVRATPATPAAPASADASE